MHLIYLDESGNSRLNLGDPDQPIFALCAMVVAEDQWQGLEADLQAILSERIINWRTLEDFEVHGGDLRAGRGWFRGVPVPERIAFRDAWMTAGAKHGVRLICRTVNKKQYAEWLSKTFGQGVMIHPYVAAFALLSRCVDNYLKSMPTKSLGVLIADENKEIVLYRITQKPASAIMRPLCP